MSLPTTTVILTDGDDFYQATNPGGEIVIGGDGEDHLKGTNTTDVLRGGAGDDVLKGGGGNDFIYGGTGANFLEGGTGNDSFRFNASDFSDYSTYSAEG